MELTKKMLEQARLELPGGIRVNRTFTHVFNSDPSKNMEVDELIQSTSLVGDHKLIWVAHPFQQTVINGIASPAFGAEYMTPNLMEAHTKVKEAFEAYWLKPLTQEEYLEKATG